MRDTASRLACRLTLSLRQTLHQGRTILGGHYAYLQHNGLVARPDQHFVADVAVCGNRSSSKIMLSLHWAQRRPTGPSQTSLCKGMI